MNDFVVTLALPLLAGVVLWLLRPDPARGRHYALLLGATLVVAAARQLVQAAQGSALVHAFAGWAPPFGIVFVVDRLAALMVLLVAVLFLAAVAALDPRVHGGPLVARAVPLLCLLVFGLNGAFMTGDLFSLFVMFELVLLASYLLLQVPGSSRSLRAAFPNVAINLLASLLFFAAVGVLYGLTGSVNMADLASRLPSEDSGVKVAALSMLVVAFGTKAGLLPLMFWLPGTYPAPSAPVAAFFAGVMTKLGAVSLLRILPMMDGTALPSVLVWVGAASALLGVLAALSQYELRRLLAFHSVSQMGYIVASLGLGSVSGIAGALYFLVHHGLVKSSLYLVADVLERRHQSRDLRRMKADAGTTALLGGLFFSAAITLAGLPPTSGFIAKVAVFAAGAEAGAWVPVGALVAASLFTLASMLKIWQYAFQRGPGNTEKAEATPGSRAPLAGLVGLTLLLSASAGASLAFAKDAAAQLLDVPAYVDVVKSAPGHGRGRQGVWR
jgi:multicomponent Na+:H+ antiporter subunit D